MWDIRDRGKVPHDPGVYKAARPAAGRPFDRRPPAPVAFRVCPAGRRVSSPRPMGFTDEEDVPAEQPPTEAHPRLPGPHADEGGPARPESPPAEGSEADRRLRCRAGTGRRMRFLSRQRLRTGAEFDAAFKRGARLGGRLFLLVAAPNGRAFDRLGLAVSRRVGGSVQRNRARRLLRESFRHLVRPGGLGVDLVVVARPDLVGRGQAEVDRELRERVLRIKRPAPVAGEAPPPAR